MKELGRREEGLQGRQESEGDMKEGLERKLSEGEDEGQMESVGVGK